MTRESFIKQIASHAQLIQKQHGILPSLIIAQACLESNYGKSGLAVKGRNLFGMKGSYKSDYVEMETREWNKHKGWYLVKAKFRKYPSWYESLEDHALLYVNGLSSETTNRYSALIGETDYKKATKAVKQAGYATDPNYPELLNQLIEQYSLAQYDEKVKQTSSKNNSSVYTVKAGDNLTRIARHYHTSLTDLVQANQLNNPDLIFPGQPLIIPSAKPAKEYYLIQPGDTLSAIAVKFDTTVGEIINWNKIENPDRIYPGQRIRVN